jgi:hypothetical protein
MKRFKPKQDSGNASDIMTELEQIDDMLNTWISKAKAGVIGSDVGVSKNE